MEYKAKIVYKVKPEHPDFEYIRDWEPNKEYEYSDTYRISEEYGSEEAIAYIKRDLSLIAGGGYNTKGIYDTRYYINGKEV